MLKLIAPFESYLSAKGFVPVTVDSELTVWSKEEMVVYVVTTSGTDKGDVLYRKHKQNGVVDIEARFVIEKTEDIPPIESFINFNMSDSPWNLRDR